MPTSPAPALIDPAVDPAVDPEHHEVPGRRERKKLATRQALIDTALRLFAARGFEATTIEEIAATVDLSPRTFHRHFARKEDVLFADNERRLAQLRHALATSPVGVPVVETVRDAFLVVLETLAGRHELESIRSSLIASSATLRAHNLRYLDEWAEAITVHVAEREGCAADAPWPALVGRCSLAVLGVAWPRWIHDPGVDAREVVTSTFALLARLALEVEPPTPSRRPGGGARP